MINNNLKVFVKVAENLSITETAKELYISQPAVSNAIKNLEKELSLKLFHRDKRVGLHLTDGGEKYFTLQDKWRTLKTESIRQHSVKTISWADESELHLCLLFLL
ncbi:MAG: LysR family transcriptional regulator [Ruminococcus sp.]|nr:LysR family transcriptional regulator [Ruminococcus sp.]